ncbi:hypothetical protein GRF29_216g149505 [Pseudopithomyces chartarum]|uniref:feruloyl esterase n=1 Tax=Pseudopithomyces chartarum TaxID=1892770 RepID=A0AAN6LMI6_9PLEO|nr:hypothetical protein GRF29_216g149505 [Pseudopithomyces chartarum]
MRNLLTSAFLLLASATSILATNSAGCGKAKTLTSKQYSIQVNGKNRNYFLDIPSNYNQNNPYRLIFTWHQLGGSAQKIVNGEDPNRGGALPFYGLKALANNSAVFVVPDGLNAGWGNQNGEDVTFFDQLSKLVEADLCINTDLRFSTGFSYGGAMSYALACARPDAIRAVAVISGAQLSGCSGGTKAVAYYGQHGTSDSVLNVSQGRALRDNKAIAPTYKYISYTHSKHANRLTIPPLHPRHPQHSPHSWHPPRQKIHNPQPRKRNHQPRQLLHPRVEKRRRHQQHPPHERRHRNRNRDPPSRDFLLLPLDILLHAHARDFAIRKEDPPPIAQPLDARKRGQRFEPKERGSGHEQENVARYIVAARPLPPRSPARLGREINPRLTHLLPLHRIPQR